MLDLKENSKQITELAGSVVDKIFKRSSHKIGLAPGTVVHVGRKKVERTRLHLIDFTSDELLEKDLEKVQDAFTFKGTPTSTWLDMIGLHDTQTIITIGEQFGLHPLVLEDIANTDQRPSIEDYGDYIFMTLKMLSVTEDYQVEAEHVSIVIAQDYVMSFQEREGDVFEGVRKRIREKGRIVQRKSDYVGYALVDAIVDHYFLVLERLGERLEVLEEQLNTDPSQATLQRINKLKRELMFMRKSVWPLRDVLGHLKKTDSKLMQKETIAYVNDAYDHTIQIIDTIESLRDVATSLTDLYLSIVSNRMNEIMKVLTIFAAIFIPLTFIAGVYGMNFDHMPELSTQYGYYVVWGVFLLVGIGMLVYFRRKDWL